MSSKLCPFCLRMTEEETCPHCGKDVHYTGQPAHLPAGYVVSGKHPYVLGAALGQGGFGITYIALDMVTNDRVAIKEYYPTYCSIRSNASTVSAYSNQEEVYLKGKERFLDEARTLKSLSDLKNIVNVLDFFEANNTAYLVMEYLDGRSLKEHAAKNGKFPAQQFLEQIRPLMEDIHRMHERGVIHRDIAPDNIILLPDGQMKLIDFGAARSYVGDKSMTVVVKKGFAPVEQYLSKGSSAATDVYALAATVYYCITGKVPPDSAERQYDSTPLEAPSALGADISPIQEKALFKALEVLPKARTQNVHAFLDELHILLSVQKKTIQQNSVSLKSKEIDTKRSQKLPTHKLFNKKRILIAATAVVLTVLILGTLHSTLKKDANFPAESLSTTPTTEVTEANATIEIEPTKINVRQVATMSHEEFIAAELDSKVIIETFVQGNQSWWDNRITVYCQSPDGAYFLYELQCSEEDAAKLVPGTKIRVTGHKGAWAGEVEIMDGTFEFVEDGETFIAEALDVTELLGTDELIAHQNEFVSFTGMTVEAINYKNGEPGDDIYVTLGYNGASYEFCVEIYLTGAESDVYTTVGSLNVGDVVNVEGYLYWYEGVNPHITAISVA